MKLQNDKTKDEKLKIEVKRAVLIDDGGKCFFDMLINKVMIYGCRLMKKSEKYWIAFPSKKGKDGKYYHHVFVKLNDEEIKEIVSQIEKI